MSEPKRKIDRVLTPDEQEELDLLKQLKSEMIDRILYQAEYINNRIADVKSGKWLEQIQGGKADEEDI